MRVVVAGQIPPPYGGQNIMIAKAVAQFAAVPDCEAVHLPFFFTTDFQQARKAGFGKALELLRVIGRLLRIRSGGRIDLLIYPSGGPQTVPIIRDILLLPWMLLCARRVVLHFHAAGVADRFNGRRQHPLCRVLSGVYGRVAAAIVMTDFNRRDPEFFGIREVITLPHRILDERALASISGTRRRDSRRLLYVGHLHPDKGTDALLRAFAAVRREQRDVTLELVGECLPPWTHAHVAALVEKLDIGSAVTLSGVLTGKEKADAFARADLFVFPSVAPYESFGLVLIEAMMWQMPIVASRWRGNADVLTEDFGGVVFDVRAPLEEQIQAALRASLAAADDWPRWGIINRLIYEKRYRESPADLWFATAVTEALRRDHTCRR